MNNNDLSYGALTCIEIQGAQMCAAFFLPSFHNKVCEQKQKVYIQL